jgi:hypothetical protein
MSAQLMAFAWVAESPSASCCKEAEGHTIGRSPLPQFCSFVNRNSQSTACISRGAAALNAASSWPSTVTSSGRPVKRSARSVSLQ